jgi:DUF438 domain-containing protein
VFTDNDHVIRYLNKPAEKWYYGQRGYADLIGKSLFDCHAPASQDKIRELYRRLQDGENEVFVCVNDRNERVTMVAVRDGDGGLLGYYERSAKVQGTGP